MKQDQNTKKRRRGSHQIRSAAVINVSDRSGPLPKHFLILTKPRWWGGGINTFPGAVDNYVSSSALAFINRQGGGGDGGKERKCENKCGASCTP